MSISNRTSTASLRVFLGGIIDYAGLFPPASLDMMTSVNNFARYLDEPQSWALGHFVLPIARLDEFLNAQENVAADPWRLSGIVSANIEADLSAVSEFNRKAPGAIIETIEVRLNDHDDLERVRKHVPAEVTVFCEMSPERCKTLLPLLNGECAKLRTGGTTEQAFPAIESVVDFLARCAELRVPFKATAGLHHPLRCVRPLTYELNAREGKMHGFLNVFTAAAMAWSVARVSREIPRQAMMACLADGERSNWHFGEDAMTWSGEEESYRFDLDKLRSVRAEFALSFGSCSFEEPFSDMREMDLV